MWLDLAEMKLILEALERTVEGPPRTDHVARIEARMALRDYFRDQVARVEKVAAAWERRKADEDEE